MSPPPPPRIWYLKAWFLVCGIILRGYGTCGRKLWLIELGHWEWAFEDYRPVLLLAWALCFLVQHDVRSPSCTWPPSLTDHAFSVMMNWKCKMKLTFVFSIWSQWCKSHYYRKLVLDSGVVTLINLIISLQVFWAGKQEEYGEVWSCGLEKPLNVVSRV